MICTMTDALRLPRVLPHSLLISMADQSSSTAAKKKKGKGMKNYLRDLFKRPKSANDSASQSNDSNSTGVSLSAFGAHDAVPGKDAGSAESTASSKYIGSILVSSTTTCLSHHPDPIGPFQSATPSSNLLGSAVAQGELQYA